MNLTTKEILSDIFIPYKDFKKLKISPRILLEFEDVWFSSKDYERGIYRDVHVKPNKKISIDSMGYLQILKHVKKHSLNTEYYINTNFEMLNVFFNYNNQEEIFLKNHKNANMVILKNMQYVPGTKATYTFKTKKEEIEFRVDEDSFRFFYSNSSWLNGIGLIEWTDMQKDFDYLKFICNNCLEMYEKLLNK